MSFCILRPFSWGRRNFGVTFQCAAFVVLDSVVFANNGSIAAVPAAAPVLRRFDFFQPVKLADIFEALVYKLPGTLAFGVDFTAVFA